MNTAQMHSCTRPLHKIRTLDGAKFKDQIDAIFESQTHQAEAIMDIYKLVIPDWERVKKVHGWPEVGVGLWKFICKGFIEFDKKHHPNVFAGGIWMNNGFALDNNLDAWQISFENCTVEY